MGKRRQLVQQANLVWSERGESAVERYIQTGSFGEGESNAEPYSQDKVKGFLEGRF